ncbi:MAG: spermidine synthase, partial [Acidobacteriota bacterium]
IAEISPGVVEAAGDYFQGVNHGILHDGRVELTICDGRNFLLATEKRYDIILSDSIHPRYAGNGSLYTRDYYLMCRNRLNPGGIVSQWLPLYSLSEENFKMLLRTFQSVFPHTTVWYINSTINPFTIVIGRTEGGKIDFSALQKGWDDRGVRLDPQVAGVEEVFHLLDYFVMGEEEVRRYAGEGPLHTDDYPAIEYLASKVISREASWHWNFRVLLSRRVPVLPYLINFGNNDLEREEILSTLERFYRATTHNLWGQLYYLERRYKEMASELEKIPEINPDDLEPWEYFRLLKYKLDETDASATHQ